MGARTYPVPARLAADVGAASLTEGGLRSLAASGGTGAGWAAAICERLDVRSEAVRQTVLTAAAVDEMAGCSYRGLFNPDSAVPVVVHVVRYDPASGGLARWQGSAWETVEPEYEPVGYEYAELTDDQELLAQAIEAVGSGGSLALLATQPRGWLQAPGVPIPMVAAAGEPEGDEPTIPLPPGAKVYAIVDDMDTSAVLDLFFVMPGPAVYRRRAGAWTPAPELLTTLSSVDPPAVVPIETANLAAVVGQIDEYDEANPEDVEDDDAEPLAAAAVAWEEDLHPREAGKFAKKDKAKTTTTGQAPTSRADDMERYIREGGKRPAGVVADPTKAKKAKKGSSSGGSSSRSSSTRSRAEAYQENPKITRAARELERNRGANEDEIEKDTIRSAVAARAERRRREKFDAGLGDQLVKLLNEGRDPRQVEMLLGLRMQVEIARRRKVDSDTRDQSETNRIRSMQENFAYRRRVRQLNQARERDRDAYRRRRAAAAGKTGMSEKDKKAKREALRSAVHGRRATTAAANPPATTSMPNNLKDYWAHGKGAAKIRWGTGGDFNRCRKQLAKYLKPGQLAGACANLHRVATGTWPGKGRH